MSQLTDKTQIVKLFSHLTNCQYRWMARIMLSRRDNETSWREPLRTFDRLVDEWDKSVKPWLNYFSPGSGKALKTEVILSGQTAEDGRFPYRILLYSLTIILFTIGRKSNLL